MREDNTRDGIVEIALERFLQFFGGYAADKGMLTLPEHLHTIMRKVLEKTVKREPRPVDVDVTQLTVEICVFVDEADLQAIRISQ